MDSYSSPKSGGQRPLQGTAFVQSHGQRHASGRAPLRHASLSGVRSVGVTSGRLQTCPESRHDHEGAHVVALKCEGINGRLSRETSRCVCLAAQLNLQVVVLSIGMPCERMHCFCATRVE